MDSFCVVIKQDLELQTAILSGNEMRL